MSRLRQIAKRAFSWLPLALRRHLLFFRAFGRLGNFRSPQGYSETLSWRAINDHRALMAFTSDKLAVKEYVRVIAQTHNVPIRIPETFWVGTDLRELRALAAQLPKRWVLKPNHSCGRVRLIDTTSQACDWEQLMRETRGWMDLDAEFTVRGYWAYGQARRLLIAEERIGDGAHAPDDLKIMAFGGQPVFLFWVTGRSQGAVRYSILKADDTRLLWGDPREARASEPIPLEELDTAARAAAIELTRAVAAPFDQIRVDGYAVDGEYWFGELTTYALAGLGPISGEIDAWLGTLWQLPNLSANDPREEEWRALLEGVPRGTLQRGTQHGTQQQ